MVCNRGMVDPDARMTRAQAHSHAHSHAHSRACGAAQDGCCAAPPPAAADAVLPPGWKLFRIAAMDCAAEESEIRHAVRRVAGIRGLRFELGARTLAKAPAAVKLVKSGATVAALGSWQQVGRVG